MWSRGPDSEPHAEKGFGAGFEFTRDESRMHSRDAGPDPEPHLVVELCAEQGFRAGFVATCSIGTYIVLVTIGTYRI